MLKFLGEEGRRVDLITIIESIVSGKLSIKNIALNLLLDLGQYLNQTSSGLMRYSKTTLDFWTIVQKLFKGKGIRFFTGEKSHVVD